MKNETCLSQFNIPYKILLVLLLICFGFIPLFVYPAMMWQYHASKVLLMQFILLIALAFLLYQYRSSDRIDLTVNTLDIIITLYPVLFFLLYLFLPQYSTLPANIGVPLSLTLFYWLTNALFMRGEFVKGIKIFLWIFLFTCTAESIYGLLQYFDIIKYKGDIIYESVIIGTLGNANSVAGYLGASLPLSLGLFLLIKGRLLKYPVAMGIILTLIIIGLTRSRGSWLALSVALLVFNFPLVIKIWQKLKKRIFRFITILFLIVLMGAVFFKVYHIDQTASQGRIFLWKISALMIKQYPVFGIGYGNYPIRYLNYQAKFFEDPKNSDYYDHAANIKQAHNQYLQIFAETGIVGFIFFVLLVYIFYHLCIRILSCEKERSERWQLTRAFMTSSTLILIHSLFDGPLNILPTIFLFYFNFAVISVFAKKQKFSSYTVKVNVTKYQPCYSLIYNILFIVYLIFAGVRLLNIMDQVDGYKLWKNGYNYANRHNWNAGIRSYHKALKYIPHEGELHFHLAGAYVMNQQYRKALPEFKIALESFHDKNIYLSCGMAYQQLRDYRLAEKNYQTVIAMFPNLLFPRYLLGKMYYESGQIEKAESILESILYINPRVYNKDTEAIKSAAEELLNVIK
jgi:O-antigen ligase